MAQNLFGFIPYEDEPESNFGFIPYEDEPEPIQSGYRFTTQSEPAYPEPERRQPEQSWLDWGISNTLRTAPAVGGAIIGGAGGLLGAGVGAVPGAMFGGALGSFIGSGLGQGYEYLRGQRDEFNPWEATVETVAGGIPPIFGPAKLAAGAGVREAMKYAGKSALSNALEGAAVSGASTPFFHAAQTGSFNAPLSSYAANTGFGALTGGTLGFGLQGVPAIRQARGLQQVADARTPPPLLAAPPPPRAANLFDQPLPVYGPHPAPPEGQLGIPFGLEESQTLPGKAPTYPGQNQYFPEIPQAAYTPSPPQYSQFGDIPGLMDQMRPVAPQMYPAGTPLEGLPRTITLQDPNPLAILAAGTEGIRRGSD